MSEVARLTASKGAYLFHRELRTELENYIITQYFRRTPILNRVVRERIDEDGLLYRTPFIEASKTYESVKDGVGSAKIEDWLKDFFDDLIERKLGVFQTPYTHQIQALEAACAGKDVFVSTGTGSGKTECFFWPILAKLVREAKETPEIWQNQRGVRALIMYPMNALVADQQSRFRRTIGDPNRALGDHSAPFITAFRAACGYEARRPQFGMYTGRVPYPGDVQAEGFKREAYRRDKIIAETLETLLYDKIKEGEGEELRLTSLCRMLVPEGRLPAKADFAAYIARIRAHDHTPDPEDAELTTRLEIQKVCPDILITNYSMLEYMLFRPVEASIWARTKERLDAAPDEKFLIVIDEAHMYRGAPGDEVALLLRRLMNRLGIERDRVQFILTTASMPNNDEEDRKCVAEFARDLTSATDDKSFTVLMGDPEVIPDETPYDVPVEAIVAAEPGAIETESTRLDALNEFWRAVGVSEAPWSNLDDACAWMYDNLLKYRPFKELIAACRGEARSLDELAKEIFPDAADEDARRGINALLALAPLAKRSDGAILFPVRMHMLFRGLTGVYACANPHCPKSRTDQGLTLGEIYLSDGRAYCKECGSVVYELCNDRRCGALFFRGYVVRQELESNDRFYLWRYNIEESDFAALNNAKFEQGLTEIYLYIPREGETDDLVKGGCVFCYLDLESGYVYQADDSYADDPNYRLLCYYTSDKTKSEEPSASDSITFYACPHCKRPLSRTKITSLDTRGNQSFYNLILAQFKAQPPAPGKSDELDKFPNEGRKVLLFSDSRQRAARLAEEMSEASESATSRALFALAVKMMEKYPKATLDDLYDFFCLALKDKNILLFSHDEMRLLQKNVAAASERRNRMIRRRREYEPNLKTSSAPTQFQANLVRLFSGDDTLIDTANCWIEPTDKAIDDIVYAISDETSLDDDAYDALRQDVLELFNAWYLYVCDEGTALGASISDAARMRVRPRFGGYGIDDKSFFSPTILKVMGWSDGFRKQDKDAYEKREVRKWKRALEDALTSRAVENKDDPKLYLRLDVLQAHIDEDHVWYRCRACGGVTPYMLKNRCPYCGFDALAPMEKDDFALFEFWRRPVERALAGERVFNVDTEEHTAQLTARDNRDRLWEQTEKYELAFQDFIAGDDKTDDEDVENGLCETPVDILSCTTTMEVGVDIGSLVAIGLRNVPPMRENYQQRAGRAGRRGASLSTIVTFCDGGAYDGSYFKDPTPMFRGDPRRPKIDVENEKLIRRHINMLYLSNYLRSIDKDMESLSVFEFATRLFRGAPASESSFVAYLEKTALPENEAELLARRGICLAEVQRQLIADLEDLKRDVENNPELFGYDELDEPISKQRVVSLTDALYNRSIIPTYSFPKSVVSTYIPTREAEGKRAYIFNNTKYEVSRGLDIAISEYAPGRAITVDKQTYVIGGFYLPGSENWRCSRIPIEGADDKTKRAPAHSFIHNPKYLKGILRCKKCGWFGLKTDFETVAENRVCPFCGRSDAVVTSERKMLRPWAFAPKDGKSVERAQVQEKVTRAQEPLYSTLPTTADVDIHILGARLRSAARRDQRVIMMNRGLNNNGFTVCCECGAAVPANPRRNKREKPLAGVGAPYPTTYPCRHARTIDVDLGFDFVTDMTVLEIAFNDKRVNVGRDGAWNPWIRRGGRTLAEALRMVVCKRLDVDYTELAAGYRMRSRAMDVYLHDSLSSGAGYATSVTEELESILDETDAFLDDCDCDSACEKCLKHFRNRPLHGSLDRIAARQLLRWARFDELVDELSHDEQFAYLKPLATILSAEGCELRRDGERCALVRNGREYELVVEPGLKKATPNSGGRVYVSEALLKYAKPAALDAILVGVGAKSEDARF